MCSDIELFNKAMKFVFQWEGGVSDDPADSGGVTKYGVCLRFYRTIHPNATRADILALTKEQASDIFYSEFWLKCHCDELFLDKIAVALFDTAVNTGVSQAVKFLQRAVNVKADGKMGIITISAVNEHTDDEQTILDNFIKQRQQFYKDLATRKPSQQVFLKGWLNRTNALATLCDGIMTPASKIMTA